jgi:hypothetical protein
MIQHRQQEQRMQRQKLQRKQQQRKRPRRRLLQQKQQQRKKPRRQPLQLRQLRRLLQQLLLRPQAPLVLNTLPRLLPKTAVFNRQLQQGHHARALQIQLR